MVGFRMASFNKRNRRLISVATCVGTAVLVWAALGDVVTNHTIYQPPAVLENEPDPCANGLAYSMKSLPTRNGINRMSITIYSPQAVSRVRIITDMNTVIANGVVYVPSAKAFSVFTVYVDGTAQLSSDKPVTHFLAVLYSYGPLAIRCVTAQ
jgi:hypothetical protein